MVVHGYHKIAPKGATCFLPEGVPFARVVHRLK